MRRRRHRAIAPGAGTGVAYAVPGVGRACRREAKVWLSRFSSPQEVASYNGMRMNSLPSIDRKNQNRRPRLHPLRSAGSTTPNGKIFI